MIHWWMGWLKRLLQSLLTWVNAVEDESPRKDKASFLSRDVHVPTPLVTAGAAAVLFFVLIPEIGLTFPHVVSLLGFLTLLVFFFVVYFRYDLPQFINDDEAVFLTGLCVVLGVIFIEIGRAVAAFLRTRCSRRSHCHRGDAASAHSPGAAH